MDQLLLDLIPQPAASFANFVVGNNREAVAALCAAVDMPKERFLYLWGAAGSGKTHLLRAAVAAAGARARYIEGETDAARLAELDGTDVIAVDDVHRLSDTAQVELFHRHNAARESGRVLIAAGDNAPLALALRPELTSRLAGGLVYKLHALSDQEKSAALAHAARERGFELAPELTRYLLSHCRRDLASLMALIARLDRFSIAAARPITLPLLKQMLEQS